MRAPNMQALTNDIRAQWPGATVWGKGDAAHQGSPSDHNEDDTPGSRPEQEDADDIPEHRAIDVAKLGPVTMPVLRTLCARLIGRPVNRARLKYVILEQTIWRRNGGWVAEHYSGEFHDHLHVSGLASDDANADQWDIGPDTPAPTPDGGEENDVKIYMLHATDGAVVGRVFLVVVGGGTEQIRWIGPGEFSMLTNLGVPMASVQGGERERLEAAAGIEPGA